MSQDSFSKVFGSPPTIKITAPGRVNLIGEHTDYNGGFILPAAIDLVIQCDVKPRKDRLIRVYSRELLEFVEFDIDSDQSLNTDFKSYIAATIRCIKDSDSIQYGYDCYLKSEIPVGAGLSSSAALVISQILCLEVANSISFTPDQRARLAHRVENQYLGLSCGIMDPLIIATAQKEHALFYHCETEASEQIRIPKDLALLVIDTGTRRSLLTSDYNARYAECQKAAQILKVNLLSHIDINLIDDVRTKLASETLYRRVRHVVTENDRVQKTVEAFKNGDSGLFGRLLAASHKSLRDDFDVSSKELDAAVDTAMIQKECLGARLMGAGFAGCVLAVCQQKDKFQFENTLRKAGSFAPDYKVHIHQINPESSAKII